MIPTKITPEHCFPNLRNYRTTSNNHPIQQHHFLNIYIKQTNPKSIQQKRKEKKRKNNLGKNKRKLTRWVEISHRSRAPQIMNPNLHVFIKQRINQSNEVHQKDLENR